MKKCNYCESEALDFASIICEKCKKNEQKYGKPEVCKYCQLPAAFLDQKCVHCCHSERKLGPPIPCHKCQLKCAFPKDPSLKNKPILCRRCVNANSTSKHPKRGSDSKPKAFPDAKRTKIDEKPSTSRLMDENNESSSQTEHFLLVQQLRTQILELKSTITQKDQQILDRDKKIAQLNAETVQIKTEHKSKMEEQRKNYVNIVNSMKENQRSSSKTKNQK